MELSRQEYWPWVALPSSKGSSQRRGSNPCLLHLLHWQVLYHQHHLGSPFTSICSCNTWYSSSLENLKWTAPSGIRVAGAEKGKHSEHRCLIHHVSLYNIRLHVQPLQEECVCVCAHARAFRCLCDWWIQAGSPRKPLVHLHPAFLCEKWMVNRTKPRASGKPVTNINDGSTRNWFAEERINDAELKSMLLYW